MHSNLRRTTVRQLKHAFAAPTQSRTRWGDANSDQNAHYTVAMEKAKDFSSPPGVEQTVKIVVW